MHIPRPAKLLFTVDDGGNHDLEKHGDSVSQWTRLAVESMLACAMGVRRYCCASLGCTHPLFLPELQVKGLLRLRHEVHRAVDC